MRRSHGRPRDGPGPTGRTLGRDRKLLHVAAMDQDKGANRVLRSSLKVGASLLVAFLLGEGLLRLVPHTLTDFHSSFQYSGDPDVGYLPLPRQDAAYNLACLRNPHVRTNGLGFRGGEWQATRSPRIALLGDSYMLALTIDERRHLASLLRSSTGGEIWNAGVSGYGTFQELLVWRKVLRDRKPDLTVLFLYLENDVRDNHCGLSRAEGQIYSPCLEIRAGEPHQRTDFELRRPDAGWKTWLKTNCYTFRALRKLSGKRPSRPPRGRFFDQESFAYNVYRPHLSRQWDEAWQVTEWALKELKAETEAAGSRLLVVNVPGPLQLAPDWRAELTAQIGAEPAPADFDMQYPLTRLEAIAASAAIDLLDLRPAFLAYRDRHALKAPVFGWCCDGHWNPLGHRLAADLVHDRLVASGWIEGEVLPETAPPLEVLGEALYADIFQCGTAALE